MPSSPDGRVGLEQQFLGWLRQINLRLEELTHLQRIALLGDERIFEFLWQDCTIRFFLPNASSDLIQRYILNTSTFFEISLLSRFGRYVSEAAIVVCLSPLKLSHYCCAIGEGFGWLGSAIRMRIV